MAVFDGLYDATFDQVLTDCRRRTRSLTDAEDAAAETYLVAWRRLEDATSAVFAPSSKATRSMVEVQDRLVEQINPQVCPSFDDARRLAEEALADAGIDDWTVVVSQPPPTSGPARPSPSTAPPGGSCSCRSTAPARSHNDARTRSRKQSLPIAR